MTVTRPAGFTAEPQRVSSLIRQHKVSLYVHELLRSVTYLCGYIGYSASVVGGAVVMMFGNMFPFFSPPYHDVYVIAYLK